jgi:hypothetical protein
MYGQSDIEDAVEGGALTAEQAASLRNFVARRSGTPTADEEPVRWLLGFNDYYVFISSILLICGLGWLGSKVDVGRGPSFVAPLLVALGAWGLSEFFGRKKRLALTAIALTAVFVFAVMITIMFLAIQLIGENGDRATGQLVTAVAAALAAGGAFLHWKRFAEPVAVALGTGMVAIAIMSLLNLVAPNDPEGTVGFLVLTLLGVATLVYALVWDSKDIRRITKKGDIGFWLHYVAAWETVTGLVGLLGLYTTFGSPSQGAAIGGIVVFLVLALIGLVLDRRLWVLFGAWPLGIGLHTLIKGGPAPSPYGVDGEFGTPYTYSPYGMGIGDTIDNIMLTILIVGVVLILIGMFWTQIRGALGALAGPLAGKVPATSHKDSESQAFE